MNIKLIDVVPNKKKNDSIVNIINMKLNISCSYISWDAPRLLCLMKSTSQFSCSIKYKLRISS